MLLCVRQGFAAKNNGAILPRICYNSCIYLSEVWYYGRIAPYSGKKNARMPIEDIAAMLDKTPEEIAAMMDEAAAKGYIRGYETLVDWEQAGVNLVEAVIELRVTPPQGPRL